MYKNNNMKTFVKLNKNEMKMVMGGVEEEMLESGGGTMNCCAHTQGWTSFRCGYGSASEAEAAASAAAISSGQRTFYCCANCNP
jgi:hypothetical protein